MTGRLPRGWGYVGGSYQLLHGSVTLLGGCDDKLLHRAQDIGHEVVEVDVNNGHIVSLRGEHHDVALRCLAG